MSAFPQPLKFLNLVWRLLCFVWLRKRRKYRKKHPAWTKYVKVAKRQKCLSTDFGYYQLSQRLNCDSIPFNIDLKPKTAKPAAAPDESQLPLLLMSDQFVTHSMRDRIVSHSTRDHFLLHSDSMRPGAAPCAAQPCDQV